MALSLTISEDRLKQLMKDAYEDGFDDGANWDDALGGNDTYNAADKRWPGSVTHDRFDAVLLRYRNGGKA